MTIIYEKGSYRIIELAEFDYSMEDLKGDTYCPRINDDIPTDRLKTEELEFERLVESEGVYGYELQKWDPQVDEGWSHVDSCYGFVGQYSEIEEIFNHYIINEFKRYITKGGE